MTNKTSKFNNKVVSNKNQDSNLLPLVNQSCDITILLKQIEDLIPVVQTVWPIFLIFSEPLMFIVLFRQ